MSGKFLLALCLSAFVYSTNCASAPFITKCKGDDSKCINYSTQAAIPIFAAGIPELGVEKMDPITLDDMDASSPNLKFLLKDFTGTGLSQCVAKKMQRDISKSKLFVKLLCSVDFEGQYEMKGEFLVVNIEGKGKIHALLRKIQISVDADLKETTVDGVKHWTIKDWKHSFELKDKASLELENLLGANEDIARAARELVASSSNEIVSEIGPPIIKAVTGKVIDNVKQFFSKVPLSELVEE